MRDPGQSNIKVLQYPSKILAIYSEILAKILWRYLAENLDFWQIFWMILGIFWRIFGWILERNPGGFFVMTHDRILWRHLGRVFERIVDRMLERLLVEPLAETREDSWQNRGRILGRMPWGFLARNLWVILSESWIDWWQNYVRTLRIIMCGILAYSCENFWMNLPKILCTSLRSFSVIFSVDS